MNVVIAYADAEAGERGVIYQACNWLYLGHGNGRGDNATRQEGRPVGTDQWFSSKRLRAFAREQGFADTSQWWKEARASGLWEFRRVRGRARYVTFTGPRNEKRAARPPSGSLRCLTPSLRTLRLTQLRPERHRHH